MHAFHTRLKEEREKKGYSQNDLAEKLNISRQSISKWERNVGYPNIETLIEMSDIFDVTIDELLKGDQNLQEKLIQDGRQLKYPRLKLFFDVLIIIGIIAAVIGVVLLLLFSQIAWIPVINGVILALIGWIGTFFTSRKYV